MKDESKPKIQPILKEQEEEKKEKEDKNKKEKKDTA